MSQLEFDFMYGPKCDHSNYAFAFVIEPDWNGYIFCTECQKILK